MGSPPKTLQETLTPVLWLNSICCRDIFEIGGQPRPIFSAIYVGAIIFGYLIFVIWHLPQLTEDWIEYRRIAFVFTFGMNLTASLFAIVFCWINGKHFKNVVVRCEEINKTLKPFGMGEDYGDLSRTIKHSLIIWFVFVVVLYGTGILWTLNDLDFVRAMILSILTEIPIVMNTVDQLNFVGLIWWIDRKLCKINSLLSEISEAEHFNRLDTKQHKQLHGIAQITITMGHNTRKNYYQHLLGTLKQAHLEIIRISRAVNEIFCGQILLEMMVQFVMTVGALYNIYFEIISHGSHEIAKHMALLILIFWVFLSVIKLVLVNNRCEMPVNETKIMGHIIRELDCLFTDKDIKEEIQQFSLQLVLHPLYFTTYNFLSLNNRFTSTFCGTVTTYLVILIQMTTTRVT